MNSKILTQIATKRLCFFGRTYYSNNYVKPDYWNMYYKWTSRGTAVISYPILTLCILDSEGSNYSMGDCILASCGAIIPCAFISALAPFVIGTIGLTSPIWFSTWLLNKKVDSNISIKKCEDIN